MSANAYIQINNSMISMAVEQANKAACSALKVIDGDILMELKPGSESGSSYYELLIEMRHIKDSCGITRGVTNVTEMTVDLTSNVKDIGNEADTNMAMAERLQLNNLSKKSILKISSGYANIE